MHIKLSVSFVLLLFALNGCADKTLYDPPELVETGDKIISPPAGFHPFYKKYINANGIPITGSAQVQDAAFIRARRTIINMLAKRPDVLAEMVLHNARVAIIAAEEVPTDLPEYANVENPAEFNDRARAYGGTPEEPFATCAEENVMRAGAAPADGSRADGWDGEDILVHEFAHLIHQIGLLNAQSGFQAKLDQLYNNAKSQGLWQNTYAMDNFLRIFCGVCPKLV